MSLVLTLVIALFLTAICSALAGFIAVLISCWIELGRDRAQPPRASALKRRVSGVRWRGRTK
jgi:hypothetical protein